MKAIRVHEFGEPEVMHLEDAPEPGVEAGQVSVRVRAIGVNPVDTYVRAGLHARTPTLPYTPGMDAAGTVAQVGAGVEHVREGDRVYLAGTLSGAYAELALCEDTQVHPLPDGISFPQGAAVGVPYATAYRALFQRAQARRGETVFIHGASGGVGIAAVQLARAYGLSVIGTGGTEEGRRLAAEQGAQHVLDHGAPDYLEELLRLTGGRGADVILEMLANVNLDQDLSVIAARGRVVVVGNRGRVEIDPRQLMARDADILGMSLFNATTTEMAEIHQAIVAGLSDGTLRPVVGQEFALIDAPRAHRAVMEAGAHGKIVLLP